MKLRSFVLGAVILAMAGGVSSLPANAGSSFSFYNDSARANSVNRGNRLYVQRGHPYYRGYRGYARQRPGYRFYAGYWFPGILFAPDVVVTSPPHRIVPGSSLPIRQGLSTAHYRWCDARYVSYRAYDNSFQPYHGHRKQCISPYR